MAFLLISSFLGFIICGPVSDALTLDVSNPLPNPGAEVTIVCSGEFSPVDIAVMGKQTSETGGFFESISANNILIGKYATERFSLTQEIVGSTRIYTLRITDVWAEDTAFYVCINPEKEESAVGGMEVAAAPSRVYFEDYEEGQELLGRHGDVLPLSCFVNEVIPDAKVELLAAGSVIEPSDLEVTSRRDPRCTDDNNDCLLHYFYEVSLTTSNFVLSRYFDDQTIQCRAESSADWEPVFTTLNARVVYTPYSDSSATEALWLGQTDVTISVVINSNPELSSLTLFAFGQPIPPEQPVFGVRFSITEVSPKQTTANIHLDEVMAFHFGGYLFTAVNEEGELSFMLNIVEGSPVTETTAAPVPTTRDPDFGQITISASRSLPDPGEPLIVRCDLSTRFTTDVQIWKSISDNPLENSQLVSVNEELEPAYGRTGRHAVVYSESEGIRTFQLFVSSTQVEETAYYSCFAVDEDDWATTLVEVNEGPMEVGFPGYAKNGSMPAFDDEEVDLDCQIVGVAPSPRVRVYVGEEEAEEFEVDVTTVPNCFPPTDDCILHFNYNLVAYTRSWRLTKFLNRLPIVCQALYPTTNATLAEETLWTDISFLPYTLSESEYEIFVGLVNFSAAFDYKYNPDLSETPFLEAFGQRIYPGNTVFGVTFDQKILPTKKAHLLAESQQSIFFVNITQVVEFHAGTYKIVTQNAIGTDVFDVVLTQVEAPTTLPTTLSTSQFPTTTTRDPDVVTIAVSQVYPKEGDNVTIRCWQRHNGQAYFLNLRKQTDRTGGDYEQVAINAILFDPYESSGRHQLDAYWNASYVEIKLTIYDATEQDTAFYHCYSSLDETVDVEKAEIVHTPHLLHWEDFETNGTVTGYYRDRVEVECWARNAAPSPRMMVYIDGSTHFSFRTASYQVNYCVGENSPDCLLHYAYDAQIYSESQFRLDRSYHTKALQCVSSFTNQETMESLLFMNVTTEPYTPTYNYFYEYEGTTDFAMVFDLRYNPDLMYSVMFYTNNFQEYYPPGQWINGSIFYEESIENDRRLIFFNITELEDFHFGRYTLETGNSLGNMSLNIYLNSLGDRPKSPVPSSLKKSSSNVRRIEFSEDSFHPIEPPLFPGCFKPIPGCKRMYEVPVGDCQCHEYYENESYSSKKAPKFDAKLLGKSLRKLVMH